MERILYFSGEMDEAEKCWMILWDFNHILDILLLCPLKKKLNRFRAGMVPIIFKFLY